MNWNELSRDVARTVGTIDGGFSGDGQHPWIVAAVRVATLLEREACAALCEDLRVTHGNGDPDGDECAEAIRARSNAS